jgi:hypothetical protein
MLREPKLRPGVQARHPVPRDGITRTNRLLVALGCAILALAIGFWATRGHVASGSTPATGASVRARGPVRPPTRTGRHVPGAGRTVRADTRPAAWVRGTVIERGTTRAVGDSEVVFSGPGGETTTRAGADGRYEVFVRPGAYRPFVRARGVASAGRSPPERLTTPPRLRAAGAADPEIAPLVVITADEAGVDLYVETSGVVTGRVANRIGQPVAHALVRARGAQRPILGTDVAETGDDGTFELALPSGGYVIDASHPDYAGLEAGGDVVVAVEAGSRPDPLALTLVAGCIVRGRVLDVNGAPVTAGSIEHRKPGMGDFASSGSIEGDGTFRWTTVEEGELSLRAWPWMSPPTKGETFRCTEGARFETTLRLLDASPDLDGTIVTAGGDPVPYAFLDILALSPGGLTQQERADERGEWAVYAQPAGEYLVTASVPGEGFVQKRVVVPAHDVALALGGTGAIAGNVAGVDDGAVAMEVSPCGLDGPGLWGPRADVRLVPVHGGRFRIDGVPACDLKLQVRVGERVARADVAVAAGRDSPASLDLSPPPAVVEAPPDSFEMEGAPDVDRAPERAPAVEPAPDVEPAPEVEKIPDEAVPYDPTEGEEPEREP